MAKGRITKRLVDELIADAKSAGKALYRWDETLTGFGVLATRTGAASYFIEYRLGGRSAPNRRFSIGKHGTLTPDEARRSAKELLGKVAAGRDVAAEKRDGQRKLATGNFKEVAERYLSLSGNGNKSWPETRRLIEFDAIPVLGKKPMAAITRGDVASLLDKVSLRSPSVARALFAALRPMFRWATDRSIIEQNPILDLKGPPPVAKRRRTLDENELIAFWRAASLLDWPFCPVYRLLLLTGQRREEVAGMRWDELDLDKGIWRLPSKEEYQPQRTKNGEEHFVDLSPQALLILKGILGERRGLVFTTTGETPVSGFSKVKMRLDKLMSKELGVPMRLWRTHDLRRTLSTMMAEHLDIDEGVIDRIQNHITGTRDGLKGVYQQQQYRDKRRRALLDWGAYVEGLVGLGQPSQATS
ncbi:MAG: tyrosine-type recombinase/integrase [Rhodomicrobium sp.]